MGYIAREISTNKVFYSRGANKIATKLGISPTTITKFFKSPSNQLKEKSIKGYLISKTTEIENQDRGSDIKAVFYGH